MPINSKHPQLEKYEEIYEFLEDFYDGEQVVKSKAEKYVPSLSGQTKKKFDAYVNRGVFYSAFSKTIDALTGSTFNVPPAIKLPEKLEYLRNDATGKGTSLTELAIALCVESLKTGRSGLLLDRPVDGGAPYFVMYDADDITNWRDNEFIVLEDGGLVPNEDDPYKVEELEGFRELRLVDDQYVVRIWRQNTDPKSKTQQPYIVEEEYIPENFGRPISYLPFVFIGPNGLDSNIGRPPLLDLANVQKISFQVSCDYANAIHVICVPTPYITGLDPGDNFELKLGADSSIILPNEGCKVGFLEFQGQGLDPVRQYTDRLEQTMAALGARVAEQKNNKTLIETATGSRIREALAVSTLGSILATVEMALNKCLKWAAEWEGANPDEAEIVLNKELVSAEMSPNMVQALIQAVQSGLMSYETFYAKLSDAGLAEPGVSAEEEFKRIEKSMEIYTKDKSSAPNGSVPLEVPDEPTGSQDNT